ncbi:hypothetical protein BKE38_19365 [Pseudoroseomonas deserti]|uniref:Uncharacterized protein n=1 Tax=Teichococcus deserti TaxID=1817963 RepID=A0A1V2GYG3_9PROT|nr:hypothetical protein [Pseudoroseomonas deserti]ONG50105.1 hypothetical protein BKE38_19365 [Pseudoroseomonas deserti]
MASKLCSCDHLPASAQEALACAQKWDNAVQRMMKTYAGAKFAINAGRGGANAAQRFEDRAEVLHQAMAHRHHCQLMAEQLRKRPLMLKA